MADVLIEQGCLDIDTYRGKMKIQGEDSHLSISRKRPGAQPSLAALRRK